VVPYLSQAWLELQLVVTKDLPERPGATARVQHVVTGAPEGEVRYHQSVVDGRLAEVGLGDDPAAEVTLTQTYADAREVASGELDASAAFMQGRTKVVGDMGKVMALMPVTQSTEYQNALAELNRQTTY
jgi:predicted lipid carrier protein YhbT